ncbi:ATP-binding cassette domain-containing protein [Anaerospora sp.]|uniref:ABC transporter ATP-binding protein n=1 Tax=Anaerospora sp. TaxID=1960278 RepID=UPI0028A20386|nr:ATP-binding cassette domain-containing protein [Anaerospora sp.]
MLEVIHVRKEFRDGRQIITAVNVDNLVVETGEQLALVGPSGSGKTTLLHLLSGLLTPTSGEIKYNNIKISAMPERWRDTWRSHTVGYVFQKLNLLNSLTILDNLLAAMSFSDAIDKQDQLAWASHLLDQVGLADRLHSFPRQLSMGEQQRVAIARAVVNRPWLILADEPTASLDQANGQRVLALLRQLAKSSNSTLLVSSHDSQIIDQFQRVVPLRQVNTHAAYHSLA